MRLASLSHFFSDFIGYKYREGNETKRKDELYETNYLFCALHNNVVWNGNGLCFRSRRAGNRRDASV